MSSKEYIADWRARNPQFKERNAKLGQARKAALSRLQQKYYVEYEIILLEEKKKLGLLD